MVIGNQLLVQLPITGCFFQSLILDVLTFLSTESRHRDGSVPSVHVYPALNWPSLLVSLPTFLGLWRREQTTLAFCCSSALLSLYLICCYMHDDAFNL